MRKRQKTPPGQGLDWDKIRREYAEKRRAEGATEEEIASEQVPGDQVIWAPGKTPKDEAVKLRKSRAKANPISPQERGRMASKDSIRVPPSERGAMATLYRAGITLAEIGRRTSRTRGTVRKVLKEDGVWNA